MAGGVGHTDGLTNLRPWRERCRACYSNTGGPSLPRKGAPLTKKKRYKLYKNRPSVTIFFSFVDAYLKELERNR